MPLRTKNFTLVPQITPTQNLTKTLFSYGESLPSDLYGAYYLHRETAD
jgi:hypothetical protein